MLTYLSSSPLCHLLLKLLERLEGYLWACWAPGLFQAQSLSPLMLSSASLVSRPGSRCFVLAVQRCPAADTTYTCELQSPGLSPLRVPISVTIIQGTWGLGSSRLTSHLLALGAPRCFPALGPTASLQSLNRFLPQKAGGWTVVAEPP